MSDDDCYLLEVAALLHDIGKLGVPDAILLKPGPLTRRRMEGDECRTTASASRSSLPRSPRRS